MGIFERLKKGLRKTQQKLGSAFEKVFSGKKLSFEDLESLEETLLSTDLGYDCTAQIIERIEHAKSSENPKNLVRKALLEMLGKSLPKQVDGLHITMLIGVNGVGKTTTIGKLAHREKSNEKSVMIAAADTFRAAAVEQLEIWAKRSGVQFIKNQGTTDPSAVAFDAAKSASAKSIARLFIDTAGRLHNKVNLMNELQKMQKVLKKATPKAEIDAYLILDATTGQNAYQQAVEFSKIMHIDGIVLTKLDGTAKGGIVVRIASELDIPIRYIGFGEQMDDIAEFEPEQFVDALIGDSGQ